MQAHQGRNLGGATWLGIVEELLWSFAEPDHYLPHVLHMEIGIVDKVMT